MIPYPNATLAAEYDVTEQIFITHKTYGITATFAHVYGHQDKNIPFEKLPLEAQLNCTADELAGDYQARFGTPRLITRLLPACHAVLDLNGMSITGNTRHQLQRAYTEPRYIGYLQQKYGWSDQTIQFISWKCLSLAIRRIKEKYWL